MKACIPALIIYYLFILIGISIFGWLLASWFDVITHNLELSPVYQSWNFFEIFFQELLKMTYSIIGISKFGKRKEIDISGDEAAYQTFKDTQEKYDKVFLVDKGTGEILAEHYNDD